MSYPRIALASSSPRRRELLAQLGVDFQLVKADIDETPYPNEAPRLYVTRLARQKALAGLACLTTAMPVLGADTIVVANNEILGKPADFAEFNRTMQLLSGRSHKVMTAVALVSSERTLQQLVSTEVYFRTLTAQDIDSYWQSGEPHDKAGGYGIQGLAAKFVQRINGSYTAVVGLPLCETEQLLQQWQEPV
ncbi:septum formation protein [Rheinheimera pacifica]|uniref:dTTP/UTP pyrophosphatase n=2 Tax=Rheinheimera pacifica TaxID=173990 RepID=A0A1H6N961_9GAMM|nr:Maf family protein [Rheinheimera pacifica]MDR6984227.1 septum formation protein [Rheinheimera pacifica]PKM17125.1 MAG: septum formation inhibitor Maf [Gammaproteobacteria bacterium HGW-Gammaproteobacteria-15]SEI11334.1 septum formation protein [Rheinheimera pacifica]